MQIEKPQDVVEFYDEFVERQKCAGINERHKSIIEKCIHFGLKPHHKVLEIGCGIGTLTKLLIDYLKEGSLYSCDIGPENIRIARENLGNYSNLILEIKDATDFCLNETFDVIVMPDVIEHIPLEYHARMFQNMNKMLKNDGFIFIHIPNPNYLTWCHEYQKSVLQVIDQPIFLEEMLTNLKDTDLYLFAEQTYSIWICEGDYTYRVLKKKPNMHIDSFTTINKKITLIDKIKWKIKHYKL